MDGILSTPAKKSLLLKIQRIGGTVAKLTESDGVYLPLTDLHNLRGPGSRIPGTSLYNRNSPAHLGKFPLFLS